MRKTQNKNEPWCLRNYNICRKEGFMVKLTDSEKEVLEILWEADTSLTSKEIINFSEKRTWKESYIHILISSLLEKEMIQVAGFKRTTKNYARKFEPTITREKWMLMQLKEDKNDTSILLKTLLKMILEEDKSLSKLNELAESLDNRKKELQVLTD